MKYLIKELHRHLGRTIASISGYIIATLFAEGVNTIMLTGDLIDSIKMIKGVKDAAPYLLYKIYEPKYKTDISLGGIELHHDKS